MFLKTVNYSFSSLVKTLTVSTILVSSIFIAANVSAQEYTKVRRLGTSEAICRGGIKTGAELQAFFANSPDTVKSILNHAGWTGDDQLLFNAIASGNFVEKKYAPGTTFQWMSGVKKGKAVSLPNRVWAGKEAFDGFEVNIVSEGVNYQMVIPHDCCNLSLATTTPIKVAAPAPKPAPVPVPVPEKIEVPVASTTPSKVIPFIAPFIGAESLQRFEERWEEEVGDSSGIIGVRAGVKYAIGKSLYLVPAVGVFTRTSINDGIDFPDEGISLDLGIEKYISKNIFIGAGVGVWNIDDSDFREDSVFVNAGGDITKSTEWFVELRGIDADTLDGTNDGFSDNHAYSAGIRFKF